MAYFLVKELLWFSKGYLKWDFGFAEDSAIVTYASVASWIVGWS